MITRRDVFKEVISPKEFEKIVDSSNPENMKELYNALYKGIHMNVRLLLDVRTNQQKLAKSQGFELKDEKREVKSKEDTTKE